MYSCDIPEEDKISMMVFWLDLVSILGFRDKEKR